MRHIFKRNPILRASALWLLTLAASCGMIYDDDLRPCRNEVRVRFLYDLNMDFSDRFGRDVRSVDVWAFSRDGSFRWHGSQEGESLAETGFYIPVELEPGTYDFIAWCGLDGEAGYTLGSASPSSAEELYVALLTNSGDAEGHVCSIPLSHIYHGSLHGVEVKAATTDDTVQDVVLSLTEDTNHIQVSVSGGSVDSSDAYMVRITDDNRILSAANIPSGTVTYTPLAGPGTAGRGGTASYSLDTSRLMAGSDARLRVVRTADSHVVIDIPLVDYLLKIKDNYTVEMEAQEFLDRENDFRLEFTLESDGSFDLNSIIHINGWVIVPSQIENPT